MNRKKFIRSTAMATAAIALPVKDLLANYTNDKVRIALLGTGLRGQDHLDQLFRKPDVDVVAICDVDDRMLSMAKEAVSKSGKKMPQI